MNDMFFEDFDEELNSKQDITQQIGEMKINSTRSQKNKADFEIFVLSEVVILHVNVERASLSVSQKFRQELENIINSGARKVIIDLLNCNLIDSTFWGAIVFSQKKIHSKNNGSIKLVFEMQRQSTLSFMVGVCQIFKVYQNVITAIDSFSKENFGNTLVEIEDCDEMKMLPRPIWGNVTEIKPVFF